VEFGVLDRTWWVIALSNCVPGLMPPLPIL